MSGDGEPSAKAGSRGTSARWTGSAWPLTGTSPSAGRPDPGAVADDDMPRPRKCPVRTAPSGQRVVMLGQSTSHEEIAVVATLPERSTHADEPAGEVADVLDHDFPARIDPLPRDPDDERRRRVEALVSMADGRPEPLEELRSCYQRRLHRVSDDFDATQGLRVVEVALTQIPRPEGLWAWQRRERL
jgi:hypothetical protein